MTDLQAATAALTENIQRDDVTPTGVAREIDRMMKEFQMKQGDIAPKLGVTQAKVSQYLSLLCLAEPLLGMLERGELNNLPHVRLSGLTKSGDHGLGKRRTKSYNLTMLFVVDPQCCKKAWGSTTTIAARQKGL
ncbi:ParB/RepB/Spo0J family partition protein [Paenibacillus elgii]